MIQYQTSSDYTIDIPEGRQWLQIQENIYPTKTIDNQTIYASVRNIHTYSVMSHNSKQE